MATTNDLKNGMTLNLDGQLWSVVDFQHVKPGKGGAFVRTKLKNVLSGKVVDRTFNAGVKVDVATVDRREMQYLYREGDDFVFMDTQDYDQPRIPGDTVGGAASYLLEDQTAVVAFNEGTPLYVELPAAVELTVSQTDPGVQGDRSTGGTKPATLETGAQIQVPLFITTGELTSPARPAQAWPAAVPARSKARKRALDVLFEAELRGEPVLDILGERAAEQAPPVPAYTTELVEGVQAHRPRIDELLAEHAQGWTLDRMPAVDRNILRIGAYELLWQDQVPDAVAISEAVRLARDLSTEGSPAFVNGLLARLLELKPTLSL